MDPLSAVSLAGTVVGLVDFLFKLVSTGYHLSSETGIESTVYGQVETAAEDLTKYTARLKPILQKSGETAPVHASDEGFTEEECEVMRRVCKESEAIAKRLSDVLEELKARDPTPRAARVIKSGILAMWNRREIEELRARLEELRQSVDSTILRAISRRLLQIELDTSAIFDKLDRQTRQITESLLQSHRDIIEDSKSRDLAVAQLLNRCESLLVAENYSAEDNQDNDSADKNEYRRKTVKRKARGEKDVRRKATEEVLNSLWFASVTERLEQVSEAHQKTFEWIFKPPPKVEHGNEETLWSDFVDWLQSGNGLYWITGKAGSGKSTLMKYIARHPHTKAHLLRWSENHRLLKSAFFFWNSGSKEQRSKEGLLKTILFDILGKAPELVPVVFPVQWSNCYNTKIKSAWNFRSNFAWDLSDLEFSFQTLLAQRVIPVKICLFIDGLDEYEGDDWRIADIVVEVAQSENIKICISSRPHIVFEDTFAKLPRLRLQDLTKPDIMLYITDMLLEDSRMKRLKQSSPEDAQGLADRIVDGASGVFLWVTLVVASLLRGLGNRDNLVILHQRLDELPTDLEQLFTQMIRKVDKVYQSEASRLFQLVAMVTDRLDTDPAEMSPLTLLWAFLAEADEKHVFAPLEKTTMTGDQITYACQQMAVTVTSRSGGLLEVQAGDIEKVKPNTTILYLHRTVKDFMRQSDIRSLLSDRTGGNQSLAFKPSVALLRGAILYLGLSKTASYALHYRNWDRLCSNAVACAIQTDRDTAEAPQVELMNRFFEVVCLTVKDIKRWRTTTRGGGVHTLYDLPSSWALLARFGLEHTLNAKLQSLGSKVDNITQAQINEALWFALDSGQGFGRPTTPAVVHSLLEHGADANHYRSTAPLTQFLYMLSWLETENLHAYLHAASKVLHDLLDHGAIVLLDVEPLEGPCTDDPVGVRDRKEAFSHSSVVHRIFSNPEFAELRLRFPLPAYERADPEAKPEAPVPALQVPSPSPSPPNGQQQQTPCRPKSRIRRFCCF